MNRNTKGTLFLFLAAIVWGCGLVAQKAGMSHLGPFAFTAIRCTLGGVIMLPLISILNKNKNPKSSEATPKYTIFGAFCCPYFYI